MKLLSISDLEGHDYIKLFTFQAPAIFEKHLTPGKVIAINGAGIDNQISRKKK